MGEFSGRAGLVTGGGMGIGRASALAFAQAGASVAVLDSNPDAAIQTVSQIEADGGRGLALPVDVGDEVAVQAAVERVVDEFGRLDFAHNNAGVMGGTALLAEIDHQEWDRVLRVNLTGVFLCMKYELPYMVDAGIGAIVNTSSSAGLFAVALKPAYVASKHGVIGLSKAAAMDYGSAGVRVNALCPGTTYTPMYEAVVEATPGFSEQRAAQTWMGRIGTPEEIAEAAVWLCSDRSRFVTGISLAVNGGRP